MPVSKLPGSVCVLDLRWGHYGPASFILPSIIDDRHLSTHRVHDFYIRYVSGISPLPPAIPPRLPAQGVSGQGFRLHIIST